MYISLNWIKDFTQIPDINIHDIANDFTMKTAEVESVEHTNSHLKKIFVAQIESIRKHPEADKLNLVTVNYGGKENLEVVCGAPNVKEGLKIPYAPIGVTLPNGLTLEPKKIRGILSSGMLCSETELELGDGSKGLMELSRDAPIGKTILDFLDLGSDTLIEVDNKSLTHRPDLWGMYGIAREFSAIYGETLKDTFNESWRKSLKKNFTKEASPIKPKVIEDSSCLAFWGLSIDGVKVQDSPRWMQERLIAVGLRPINNIVDISNYVMVELGMPLHIYDRHSIASSEIVIERMNKEAKFTTLDEVERVLVPSDTVIRDSEKTLVLAGVMGGLNSGVNEKTTQVFIEVANWKAEEVRKTSTRLGLRTDSSTRYEKSLDSQLTYRTLLRTLELVLSECPKAKVVGSAEYSGNDLSVDSSLNIAIGLDRINAHLGTQLSADRVDSIFKSLGFQVDRHQNDFKVGVPSYRATKDIEGAHDLIEEVGRIIGYDSIENVSPQTLVKPVTLTPYKEIERKVQDFFSIQARALEVMSYPLVGSKLLEKSSWPDKNDELKLVNALTVDADRMRPSLVPNFLEMASLNIKNYANFKSFEWGRIYLEDEKNFSQERNIAGFSIVDKKQNSFSQTLEYAEQFLDFLGLSYQITPRDESRFACELAPKSWSGVHPYECVDVVVRGKSLGCVFSIHPLMLREFKIKGSMSIFMLDLTDFTKTKLNKIFKYKPLAKYPASQFDCSVVMPNATQASEALKVKKKLKIKDLKDIKIVDVFQLNDDKKSVTVRFTFQNSEETLKADLIKSYEESCVKSLVDSGFPLKE